MKFETCYLVSYKIKFKRGENSLRAFLVPGLDRFCPTPDARI